MPKSLSRQIHLAEQSAERSGRSFGILSCIQQRKIIENETQLIREKRAKDFFCVLGNRRIRLKYLREWEVVSFEQVLKAYEFLSLYRKWLSSPKKGGQETPLPSDTSLSVRLLQEPINGNFHLHSLRLSQPSRQKTYLKNSFLLP